MRALMSLAVVVLAAYVVSSNPIAAAKPIYDVSWPNCTIAKPADALKGIVGVTGGLSFRKNPCLARQAGWFSREGAYINTGYPGLAKAIKYKSWPRQCSETNESCIAYNYGFDSAQYAIKYAVMNGVVAKHLWLDVETANSWSDSTLINRATLQGGYDALAKYVGKSAVGYYSYPFQWQIITGNWLNGIDNWTATGSDDRPTAALACAGGSFNGGTILLGQYTDGLDKNVVCANEELPGTGSGGLNVSF